MGAMNSSGEQAGHPAGRLAELAAAAIEPNPHQPRRRFPPEEIEALARSIEAQGVIQPLVVRPHPDDPARYQLVAGERRLRACRLLGWSHVPALVRAVPDDALLEAALVENLQREQLTPIEEASAYRTLLQHHGYTQDSLAHRIGKDRSTIANMVRLLALPPLLQEDLETGRLSVGHARALLALPQAELQVALRGQVLAGALSVRDTERLAARQRAAPPPSPQAPPDPPQPGTERDALQFAAAREMLERRLATRVLIRPGTQAAGTGAGTGMGAGGRIEIEYYSLDDFNRLYALLTR
jgi:ParB family chromosome partitioning protein